MKEQITHSMSAVQSGLLSLLLCFAVQLTAETLSTTITIENHPYAVVLVENEALTDRIVANMAADAAATHYRGSLTHYPDSWVRVSNIRGHWEGIAAFAGDHYIIDTPVAPATPSNGPDIAQALVLGARAVAPSEPLVCGTKMPITTAASSSSILRSPSARTAPDNTPHTALAIAQPVSISTLCSSTINGTCLIAELEFAFDRDFVESFASESVALEQAQSLINMVEGFYTEDFNISFDTLTMEFLTNNFSATTDASDLLNEIREARQNGQFGFLQSSNSLFHFVTGRDLDGGTAGIAFVDGLCNNFGVGLASLSSFAGIPDIPTTSIVVAHELGHNFGALHDVEENSSCGAGFIMEPRVTSANTEFSSCSISDIIDTIEALANPAQCFNFAVDAGITPFGDNPTVVDDNSEFQTSFTVSTARIYEAISRYLVTGTIPAGEGQFTSVTLDGQSCDISNQGLSYSCSEPNPATSATLVVNAVAGDGTSNFTHRVSVTASDDVTDVDPSNDVAQVAVTVNITTTPDAPSNLIVQQGNAHEVNLSWQDNSNNEEAFIVERRESGGAFSEIARVATNITRYTDTTSQANTSYVYQVLATNMVGTSTATAEADITVQLVTSNTTTSGGGGAMGWPFLLLIASGLVSRRFTT